MADDDGWVFDSLVTFLNGPIWNAPLQSFIEERSLIFEPQEPEEDDEHRKIYDDFKNLVDFMLGNFMEDIGITPVQFEQACFRGAKEGVPLHFDQNTFEQIWAANDYSMFKRMMTQRNVELQLQALELIERKFGKTPESFTPQKSDDLVKNKVEVAPVVNASELEREVYDEVSKQFPVKQETAEQAPPDYEMQFLMEEKHNLEETLKATIEEKLTSQKQFLEDTGEPIESEREEGNSKQPETEDSHNQTKPSANYERIPIDRPKNTNVDGVEIKKRQDYLRAQRDKLVAMKKEVRKKYLDEDKASNSNKAPMRPKSSKAAESFLTYGAGSPPSSSESERLNLRKTLVDRLKAEVVQHNEMIRKLVANFLQNQKHDLSTTFKKKDELVNASKLTEEPSTIANQQLIVASVVVEKKPPINELARGRYFDERTKTYKFIQNKINAETRSHRILGEILKEQNEAKKCNGSDTNMPQKGKTNSKGQDSGATREEGADD